MARKKRNIGKQSTFVFAVVVFAFVGRKTENGKLKANAVITTNDETTLPITVDVSRPPPSTHRLFRLSPPPFTLIFSHLSLLDLRTFQWVAGRYLARVKG